MSDVIGSRSCRCCDAYERLLRDAACERDAFRVRVRRLETTLRAVVDATDATLFPEEMPLRFQDEIDDARAALAASGDGQGGGT